MGTHRMRLSLTLIRTDMFRHSIFTQSLIGAIFTMTLLSSSHQTTLSSPVTLTQSVSLKLRNCLMEPPVSLLGGARTRAREMEEALLSAPLNMTLTPTYRLAWLPGV